MCEGLCRLAIHMTPSKGLGYSLLARGATPPRYSYDDLSELGLLTTCTRGYAASLFICRPFRAWAAHYFLLMTYALRLTNFYMYEGLRRLAIHMTPFQSLGCSLLFTYDLRLTTYEFLHVRGATPPRYSYDALSGLGLLTTFYL